DERGDGLSPERIALALEDLLDERERRDAALLESGAHGGRADRLVLRVGEGDEPGRRLRALRAGESVDEGDEDVMVLARPRQLAERAHVAPLRERRALREVGAELELLPRELDIRLALGGRLHV